MNNTTTLADLLRDLRYVAYSSNGRAAPADPSGNALVEFGLAQVRSGRIEVTNAGVDVVRACREVALPGAA